MLTKILISALVISSSLAGLFEYRLIKEKEGHAETRIHLETVSNTLNQYQKAMSAVNVQRTKDYQQNLELVNKHAKAKRELNALKNREATVLAKPGLVQLKINKAFNAQQARIACVSGDNDLCLKP